MIFIWCLVLAAFAANADCASRIVGGNSAAIQEYPSLAQLEASNIFLVWGQECAATIINTRNLLSAAHCFSTGWLEIKYFRIRVGSSIRQRGNIFNINRILLHRDYGRNGYDSDISVIQLSSRLVFSATVSAAVLPPKGFEMFDNAPVTLAGWGTTRVGGGGSASQSLQHVQVQVVSPKRCAELYSQSRFPVTSNMICAGTVSGGKDTCRGDEGGPLYFNRDIMMGIVSWGQGCGNAAFPRVFTKVSAYIDWINNNIIS